MRITITTIGSRGDVQPYIALGSGLQAAGHTVCVATHARFETLTTGAGLNFAPVAGDPRTVAFNSDSGKDESGKNLNALRFTRDLLRLLEVSQCELLRGVWSACQNADMVIASPLGMAFAFHAVDKLGIPVVRAFYDPASPTRHYSAAFVPDTFRLGGRLNLWTHYLSRQLLWLMMQSSANKMRRDVLNLPPLSARDPFGTMDRQAWPLLYAYSPRVVPRPPDWGNWIHVTGYWFLKRPADWSPPEDLVEFPESGPPPVYVGFGSMPNANPEESTNLVIDALTKAGQRGVLLTGWNGLSRTNVPDDFYVIDEVPHDWLFPRMAAVVHHGGAGTTAEGLRAGVPSLIIPFLVDQPYWGRRVHALGVGPRPILRERLTTDSLARAIHTAVRDPDMGRRARALGRQIRSEDGVARAVDLLDTYFAAHTG
jgi:UDP:flavonoid glycosyltransferase YjiC (YdhE family)